MVNRADFHLSKRPSDFTVPSKGGLEWTDLVWFIPAQGEAVDVSCLHWLGPLLPLKASECNMTCRRVYCIVAQVGCFPQAVVLACLPGLRDGDRFGGKIILLSRHISLGCIPTPRNSLRHNRRSGNIEGKRVPCRSSGAADVSGGHPPPPAWRLDSDASSSFPVNLTDGTCVVLACP